MTALSLSHARTQRKKEKTHAHIPVNARGNMEPKPKKKRKVVDNDADDDDDGPTTTTTSPDASLAAHAAVQAAATAAVGTARAALNAATATVAAMRTAATIAHTPSRKTAKAEPTFVRYFVRTDDTKDFAGCAQNDDSGRKHDNVTVHWIRASREDLQWMTRADSWFTRRFYPCVDPDWEKNQLTSSQVDLVMKYATASGEHMYSDELPTRCVRHVKHDHRISIPDEVKSNHAATSERVERLVRDLVHGQFSSFRV